jgi:hypothetical protein
MDEVDYNYYTSHHTDSHSCTYLPVVFLPLIICEDPLVAEHAEGPRACTMQYMVAFTKPNDSPPRPCWVRGVVGTALTVLGNPVSGPNAKLGATRRVAFQSLRFWLNFASFLHQDVNVPHTRV